MAKPKGSPQKPWGWEHRAERTPTPSASPSPPPVQLGSSLTPESQPWPMAYSPSTALLHSSKNICWSKKRSETTNTESGPEPRTGRPTLQMTRMSRLRTVP